MATRLSENRSTNSKKARRWWRRLWEIWSWQGRKCYCRTGWRRRNLWRYSKNAKQWKLVITGLKLKKSLSSQQITRLLRRIGRFSIVTICHKVTRLGQSNVTGEKELQYNGNHHTITSVRRRFGPFQTIKLKYRGEHPCKNVSQTIIERFVHGLQCSIR